LRYECAEFKLALESGRLSANDAKNGTYERQVRSSSFAKADDVAVFGNTAYTLENKKIYSISIE
jgi:hypothetical protein